MAISTQALYVAAIVCFLVAAMPHGMPVRFEFIGFALLVCTLL